MTDATAARFYNALATDDPYMSLREAVRAELSEGASKADLLNVLESMRPKLEAEGREDLEDAVLDVMSDIVGYTGPHMKL